MTKAFRFGITFPKAGSRRAWLEQVREAEQLGYDVVLVPDHIGDQLAPFPALVSAAEATERVRLGTFVLDNDFRHPLLVAHEAATVDILTGGRLELGLGAGWMGRDYERLGIEFEAPRLRFERLAETVSILNSYFRGDAFSFEGNHFRLSGVEPSPPPLQNPRPPLLIGGGGRRILQFAAQQADIVSVFLRSLPDGSGFDLSEFNPASYQRKTNHVHQVASNAGRDPELNVLIQHVEIASDRRAAANEYARKRKVNSEDVLALPFALIGTVEQVVQDLLEYRERFRISYVTVLDKYMHDFAPVMERLSGA